MSQFTISQRNTIYQALAEDGIDLQNPYLNVRTAYTQFLEKKVTTLTDTLAQTDQERQTAEQINQIIMVVAFAVLALFVIWGASHV